MDPSKTSETNARVDAKDQAELVSVSRNFFIFGTLSVALAAPLIYHYDLRQSRILFWSAGCAALAGWAGSSIVRRRANLPPDVGLTRRAAENWSVLAVFVAIVVWRICSWHRQRTVETAE